MIFAKNLRFLRISHGMDQSDLAKKLKKKSIATISAWESGEYTPKVIVLSKIAHLFNISIDDLMETDLSKGMLKYPPKDETSTEFLKLYENLTSEEKKHIMSYLKFLNTQKKHLNYFR